jgi:hypothetical protein
MSNIVKILWTVSKARHIEGGVEKLYLSTGRSFYYLAMMHENIPVRIFEQIAIQIKQIIQFTM